MESEKEKFDIFLCKDDFREGSKSWHFFAEEFGLYPRKGDAKKNVMTNIDYSILVSMLGQGYIRCLNNLAASGQNGPQLAYMLRNIINKFALISYENLDEMMTFLNHENFDLIEYTIKKDLNRHQKSSLSVFSLVNKVESKELLGEKPYRVGYFFDSNSAVILYQIDSFNTATAGVQFASYVAMFKTLVTRIDNPYAFATLVLFMIATDINIDRFGGYDSIIKMKDITLATCQGMHDIIDGRADGQGAINSEDKIAILIKNNPKGFMLMTAGIPEFK